MLARKAVLAALLLVLPRGAGAASTDTTNWIRDSKTGCALFDSAGRANESVQWSGPCKNGRAEGEGTAIFLDQGKVLETFSGNFSGGIAQDGDVDVSWGDGWKYGGEMRQGRFDGEGILADAQGNRYEGLWSQGKLNGQGRVVHADGEGYGGYWKDDLPNGHGTLIHADGTRQEGEFLDGKFSSIPAGKPAPALPDSKAKSSKAGALMQLSDKKLVAVDGAMLGLSPIEGGIERDITAANGAVEKTTFTFINEQLGTVARDGRADAANVTGFFRLTDDGVEVRYADGRNEILSADGSGGVLLRSLKSGAADSCRRFYPEGHGFSDAEKKLAVAEYASRLGLAAPGAPPSCADIVAEDTPAIAAPPHPEQHAQAAHKGKFAKASVTPPGKMAALETVAVRESVIHTIDAGPVVTTALENAAALPAPPGPNSDAAAARCLKVESDGSHWGFRNSCGFDVQFSYCLAAGGNNLTACTAGGVPGSVGGNNFSALLGDRTLSETNGEHDFRWLACKGGAGEVVARLDHVDPPSGRCERAQDVALNRDIAINKGDGK